MHILCPHCRGPIELVKLDAREEIACPSCGSSFRLEGGPTTGYERGPGEKLGKFELIDVVGHGAFGTVFKAKDPELDRVVALKVPRAGQLASQRELDRFLREARSAAQLRHPSIVAVHDVGTAEGVPYLVSDFVQGVTLADLLSARRPSFRESAEMVAAVAEALQYAHERGVVHRDVKPSNIMVGEGGPVVMDFGLAKREAGEITMTVEGQVLGTPAYMPPEQARGEGHSVDARGDVYSLGVVLYQMLTGELPFRGTARMLLHQVLHDDPKAPRALNDAIPRDLETVTLKAMAREPQRRYPSSGALADDLRRWLKGEPIQARPMSRAERAWRWVKRKPAAAALLAVSGVALLALVGLGVGAAYHAQLSSAYDAEEEQRRRAEGALGEADAARQAEQAERRKVEQALGTATAARKREAVERQRAEDALRRADHTAYLHNVHLAGLALRENKGGVALERLRECKEEHRGWEWYYLHAQLNAELLSAPGEIAQVSEDGTVLAIGPAIVAKDTKLHVYDTRTGREVLTMPFRSARDEFALRPDGARLAVTTGRLFDTWLYLYDLRTGKEVSAMQLSRPVKGVRYSPDGSRLLALPGLTNNDGTLRLFDALSGKEAQAIKVEATVNWAIFSPDGSLIAALGLDATHRARTLKIYDARLGKELAVIPTTGFVGSRAIAFSPDGARISLWDIPPRTGGILRVIDARTGKEQVSLRVLHEPGMVTFSPDGSYLLVSPADGLFGDGRVRAYDARTGQEAASFSSSVPLRAARFSPDGSRVVAVPVPGRGASGARVFDALSGKELFSLPAVKDLSAAFFTPDNSRIVTLPLAEGGDGRVRLHDARGGNEPLALPGFAAEPRPFTPDGSLVMTTGAQVRRLDSWTGETVLTLPAPGMFGATISHDGSRVAMAGQAEVLVHDVKTGERLLTLPVQRMGAFSWPYVRFSPDGSRLSVSATRQQIEIFDARSGLRQCTIAGNFFGPAEFSSDGSRLFLREWLGSSRMAAHDAATGKEVFFLQGPDRVAGTAPLRHVTSWSASGDGSRLVVRGGTDTLILDARNGLALCTIAGPRIALLPGGMLPPASRLPPAPIFSPDGTRVATTGEGGVGLYDARSGKRAVALRETGELRDLTFTPDGKRLVGTGEGAVRVYDTTTGQEVISLPMTGLSSQPHFSPDGTRLAVRGGTGLLVWVAPRDLAKWQQARFTALTAGLSRWHRERGEEARAAGQWFTAAFHWRQILRAEPDHGGARYRLGEALAMQGRTAEAARALTAALAAKRLHSLDAAEACALLGRWEEAARRLEEITATGASDQAWHRLAVLRLRAGDEDGYRKGCEAVLKRHFTGNLLSYANEVARYCVLAPLAPADLKSALAWSDLALRHTPRSADYRHTHGGLLYRAGKHTEAVAQLKQAVQFHSAGGSPSTFLFLAMAQHRLGQSGEARQALAQAKQGREKGPAMRWLDRVAFDLLLREAEELLQPKKGAEK